MTCEELKKQIIENKIGSDPLILKWQDSKFLCYQYINEICRLKNKEKIYINNLNNFNDQEDIFSTEINNNYIYIYDVDNLKENTILGKDLIIVCKEVSKDLNIDYIDMPKLLDWQMEDFVKVRLSGLGSQEIKWLCEITKYDINRLDRECSKLEIFNKGEQKILFNQMNNENAYSDLNTLTIFNFTSALLKKDYNTLKDILRDLEVIDVEATGAVTILIKNIKDIIDIKCNPYCTPDSLDMNPKKFNAIKYSSKNFTDKQLRSVFKFLTEIDYKIKVGDLALQDSGDHLTLNNKLVDYLTINLLNLMNSK